MFGSKKLMINGLICIVLMFDFFLIDNLFDKNFFVILSFLIIGLISIISILKCKKVFSPFLMTHIFIFFFMYFIAIRQYCNDVVILNFMEAFNFSDFDYFITNMIIILFQIVFNFTYILNIRKNRNRIKSEKYSVKDTIYLTNKSLYFFLVVSIGIALFFINIYGVLGVLSSDDIKANNFSQIENLLLGNFLRGFPAITLLIFINAPHNNKDLGYKIGLVLHFLIVLFLIFPFGGVSRYRVAFVYLSIIASVFKNKIKNPGTIFLIMLVAILLIFPTINFFRYNSILDLNDFKIESFDYKSGDYDAYQMLITTIKYSRNNGLLFGKNFMTALLFFVPREVWNSKMVGTGYYIADQFNAYNNNVSCPLIGEFYISFGVVGVIFGALILGFIISKFDSIDYNGTNWLIYSINFTLFGYIMFIMRGDLLSSFSYFAASILSIFIVSISLKITYNFKYKNSFFVIRYY